ncbi:hypothetical protein PPERSA_07078 [Pseudocohnilembus persalinus]|uniref:Uncharacterized protein n=1 Tax=Pseudocohnilembus persalinus TaxID=266149 RepID=A0A0V0QWZ6_PSEPJ|nr:hypothetical protein PPERSA_07078 [Pseudocohnilembus persalinus]|eukprot:KRX06915.1 hypothetical protein PPERSA_07078 [Pseudocohnilembus persalinus]
MSAEQKILDEIAKQTVGSRDDDVYVLELDNVPIQKFTPRIQQQVKRFRSLQVFSLVSCGIQSLDYFPDNPSLIRLDLVNNKINGSDLQNLAGSLHLQTLMLSHNNINKVDDLKALGHFKELSQLDLVGNEVENTENYRKDVFKIFNKLQLLDGEDKNGEYDEISMNQAASKIPQNLFERKVSAAQLNVMNRMSSAKNLDAVE